MLRGQKNKFIVEFYQIFFCNSFYIIFHFSGLTGKLIFFFKRYFNRMGFSANTVSKNLFKRAYPGYIYDSTTMLIDVGSLKNIIRFMKGNIVHIFPGIILGFFIKGAVYSIESFKRLYKMRSNVLSVCKLFFYSIKSVLTISLYHYRLLFILSLKVFIVKVKRKRIKN